MYEMVQHARPKSGAKTRLLPLFNPPAFTEIEEGKQHGHVEYDTEDVRVLMGREIGPGLQQ